MNLGKQKSGFFTVLLITVLFSLITVRPSDAKDLLEVGGLAPSPIEGFGKSSAAFAAFTLPPIEGIPVSIVSEPKNELWKIIGGALSSALWAGVGWAVDKAAYEYAVQLASGNFGQKPMWLTSAGFDELVDGAVGESIYALGDNIEFLKKYGISLCVPPDLKFQLWLQVDLTEQFQPTAPRCSFKQIKEAWGRMDEPDYWKGVGAGFRPGQNDLSLLMAANQAVKVASAREKEKAKEELAYRGMSVSPINTVSRTAKAPVSLIEKLAEDLSGGDKQTMEIMKVQQTADVLAKGDWGGWGFLKAAFNVGKIFSNTLASKLLQKGTEQGLYSISDLFGGSDKDVASSPEAQVVGGREKAQAIFAVFLKPNLPEVEQWIYTGELVAECVGNPSPFCGVLDEGFHTALAQVQAGASLTVNEAIKQGQLRGDWKLLSLDANCDKAAYCYSNLVKLRQLRVLPIGWEMAAKLSSTEKPYSLKDAIDNFYNKAHPLYHLIDPYWLLKAPVAKCGALAFGSNFIVPPGNNIPGQRVEYCADVQNCVFEEEDGRCTPGAWGYCLQEKNIWRLGADSCDEQFNTCTTYANNQGQVASYLADTIEKSICNADNVGCRAYAASSILKDDKWEWDLDKKIYFNAKATQCDYTNEGCSQFVRTGFGLIGGEAVKGDDVNLKKAPEYYNCYGDQMQSQLSSSTLKWAVNKADLSKIFDSWKPQNKEKCGSFAQVCSYEEVGCEKYTPANGDLPIPGILTENDRCPSDCVGYETFIQQDTNFEKAPIELAYFIPSPSTTKSCQEQEAGCDEFVNLEAQTAGGEGKEYYTELRQCSQNEAEGAVYYTWEGSDTAGYQLKSFNLKFGTPLGAPYDENKGQPPAYNTTDAAKLAEYKAFCDGGKYKAHAVDIDPDCREFYDKDGNKSYRLYTKTITVSATDCKKLRKSVSDKTSCDSTGGVWDTKGKNICVYLAIPKEGQSCKAAAVGCRAYKGNAGNNFFPLPGFPVTFEVANESVGKDAKQSTGWAGKFSAESTVVGGKSLKVDKQTQVTESLEKGTTYSISFWAKGLGQGLAVSVKPTDANGTPKSGVGTDIIFNVPLHADWQNYTVGPIVIDWDESAASSTVRFESALGKVFYLDNIVAKQMKENIYVVKNSWVTPSSCDNLLSDPDDSYGQSQGGSKTNPYRLVPQAMLGCQKYTDRQNNPVTVKSFTSMCREEAVGCEEFVDTHNSASGETKIFNALCQLPVTTVGLETDRVNKTDKTQDCKDDKDNVLCQVAPSQNGCYFTADKALPTAKISYKIDIAEKIEIPADSKAYLVNDKNYYCTNDAVGCSALGAINYSALNKAQAQASAYLKNQPDIYGQILCEKEAEGCEEFKTTQGVAYFKDPAVENNFCEYQNDINGSGVAGWVKKDLGLCEMSSIAILACSSDADCQNVGNKKCNKDKKVACNYPAADNILLKNGDPDYDGLVGLCPSEQNGCSEFIDPMDTTPEHASGTPYFVINNSKLDRATCGNQASLQEECVLFNETSQASLLWNASSTYSASEVKEYAKVNPVDCGVDGSKCAGVNDNNNANVILKVQRDRVCGEWLACKSSMSVRDETAASGWKEMCTELAPCEEVNLEATILTGKCGKWAGGETQVTKDTYKARDVTWWGDEYSGYTLPEAYQIQTLLVKDKKLGYETGTGVNNGVFTNGPAPTNKFLPESCRGFAQADTPEGYCSYTKVNYSGPNDKQYTAFEKYNYLPGAEGKCSGGFYESGALKVGSECFGTADCFDERPSLNELPFKEHGNCLLQKDVSRSRGWEGYCLDPAALANPDAQNQPKNCTLWYPLTTPSGSVSSDHLYASAGYVPPTGSGKFWCVEAKGNANRSDVVDKMGIYKFYANQGYKYTTRLESWDFFPSTLDNHDKDSPAAWKESTGQLLGQEDSTDYEEYIIEPLSFEKLHFSEIIAIGLLPKTFAAGTDWPSGEMKIFSNQRLSFFKNFGKGDATDYKAFYWSGPLKKVGNALILELVWQEFQNKQTETETTFDRLNYNYCLTLNERNENALAIRFEFDLSTGLLSSIHSKECDGSSKNGGFSVDLNFYLTEVCTAIRQVVDTESDKAQQSPMGFLAKGRTDRLWPSSKYRLGVDLTASSKLDLQYYQLFAPFGSFSQSKEPSAKDLPSLANEAAGVKNNFSYMQILKKSGFWPIWLAPGGATPLNCADYSTGDCGNIAICSKGPNIGKVCDNTADDSANGCEQILPPGICKSTQKICYGQNQSENEISHYKIKCETSDDCQKSFSGSCFKIGATGTCNLAPAVSCSMDNDCLGVLPLTCDWETEKHCVGGTMNNSDCTNNTNKCVGGSYYSKDSCSKEKNVRGLCVGGLNHGLACGSSLDCPSNKYSDSVDDMTEYGICVGSSLDFGKTIPKTGEIDYNGVIAPAGQWRLYELFVNKYATWLWDNAVHRYADPEGPDDYSDGWNVPGVENWKVIPTPPVVEKMTVNEKDSGAVSGAGGALNAILHFNAFADHDQMPIVRMAVDWGDGSEPYVMSGWFKNRKEKCNQKSFANGDSCSSGTDCRVRFGDSSDACETGFYEFKHIYECPGKATSKVPTCGTNITANCWDASAKSCKFKPKVQVLDNWGWCNSLDGNGKWNDDDEIGSMNYKDCYWKKIEPWTKFDGTVEVKP